jgi:hypothetical protein
MSRRNPVTVAPGLLFRISLRWISAAQGVLRDLMLGSTLAQRAAFQYQRRGPGKDPRSAFDHVLILECIGDEMDR